MENKSNTISATETANFQLIAIKVKIILSIYLLNFSISFPPPFI